jgi:hypothetical protein
MLEASKETVCVHMMVCVCENSFTFRLATYA